jgi:hypothetical protein
VTNEELTAARALCDAATSGPWTSDLDMFDENEGIVACVMDGEISTIIKIETGLRVQNSDPWTAEDSRKRDAAWKRAREGQEIRDAAFIAASRTLVPKLLDEVARLRALLEAKHTTSTEDFQ